MTTFTERTAQLRRTDSFDSERERLAYLRRPLPGNPQDTATSLKVRVLKPFWVTGTAGERPTEVGEVVELFPDQALQIVARGYAEWV